MSDVTDIPQWLQQLQQGDAAAMQRLWDGFYERLHAAVERQLEFVSPQLVEGEDVVVSVFESVWDAVQGGRLNRVADVDELLWVLLAMTRRKCIDHLRRSRANRRGGGKHPISLDGPAQCFAQIVADEPDPQYLAALNDQYQAILQQLNDATLRQITVLKIEGFRNDEIAQQLSVAESTVNRKLRIIREIFHQELRKE
jgi:RNA polymerase sigma factor (sigma-70 family)